MRWFGASAPLKQVLTRFGFTPARVAEVTREHVAGRKRMKVTEAPQQGLALPRGLSLRSAPVESGGPVVRSPGSLPGVEAT